MTLELLLGIGEIELRLSSASPMDPVAEDRIRACYAEMVRPGLSLPVAAEIEIRLDSAGAGLVTSSVSHDLPVRYPEHLMPQIDEQIVIAAQRALPALFFVHAAVLEYRRRAVLLVAESGSGKSTTCLGLVEHGFGFLSDELAPIRLESMIVESFPRALCLKAPPPSGYGEQMVAFHQRLYTSISCASPRLPIGALVFVAYDPRNTDPEIEDLSPAEAAMRLGTQSLNLLAHRDSGLGALVQIAEAVPSLRLRSAGLRATCQLLEQRLCFLDQPAPS